MTVLSDKTIKEKIANNELVPNGNADNAMHCSYEFTAKLMLRGDSKKAEKITEPGIPIEPAQLVWIRAREEISMPAKMVGLWIQTQTLARQGLLLLNISLIEPGYKGLLSAVFVNFGNKRVIISPDTKIAKVMFLPLDREAAMLVRKWNYSNYDTKLMDMAANAPETFLQLRSFLPNIQEKAQGYIESIKNEVDTQCEHIKNYAENISERERTKLKSYFQSDIKRFLLRVTCGAGLGFLIICAVIWFGIAKLLPSLIAEYSRVEEIAQKASMVQQAETITDLSTQIHTLETEIESLKKQIQADTTSTNPLSDTNNAVPNQ